MPKKKKEEDKMPSFYSLTESPGNEGRGIINATEIKQDSQRTTNRGDLKSVQLIDFNSTRIKDSADVVLINTDNGTIEPLLPTRPIENKTYYVKNIGTGSDAVIIDGGGVFPIDNSTTPISLFKTEGILILFSNKKWHILASN